jgi:hypothetical protein
MGVIADAKDDKALLRLCQPTYRVVADGGNMTDRMSRVLLALIALGLWANLLASAIRPIAAVAQYETDHILRSVDARLASVDANIDKLQRGSCSNRRLCF